jgi:CSLREA domain-containing protein
VGAALAAAVVVAPPAGLAALPVPNTSVNCPAGDAPQAGGAGALLYGAGDETYYGGGGGQGLFGGGGGGEGGLSGNCDTADSYAPSGGGGGGSSFVVAGSANVTFASDTSQTPGIQITFTPPLVVNSTADTPDPAASLSAGSCNTTPSASTATCTLRAAIEVVDQEAIAGGQTVSFDIPTGSGNTFDGDVPEIEPASDLPQITATVTIDGTTQPGSGKVEISGVDD